jgi:hypothetical protein
VIACRTIDVPIVSTHNNDIHYYKGVRDCLFEPARDLVFRVGKAGYSEAQS